MKFIYLLFACSVLTSCIPFQIAPRIKEDKIMLAKRFKRKLPKQYAFIFEDPKNADEFYHYINIKYQRGNTLVENNVPIVIDGTTYFLSFYEAEKNTQTVNLIPMVIDHAIDSNVLEDAYTSRIGKWYVIVTISDDDFNDGLHPDYEAKDKVIMYLKNLRKEYLKIDNYYYALMKK